MLDVGEALLISEPKIRFAVPVKIILDTWALGEMSIMDSPLRNRFPKWKSGSKGFVKRENACNRK